MVVVNRNCNICDARLDQYEIESLLHSGYDQEDEDWCCSECCYRCFK